LIAALITHALAVSRTPKAVDRADCLNGQRVWKTNIAMQELTVANKARLAKCWHCHPGVP
jgi:hypothetical protein